LQVQLSIRGKTLSCLSGQFDGQYQTQGCCSPRDITEQDFYLLKEIAEQD